MKLTKEELIVKPGRIFVVKVKNTSCYEEIDFILVFHYPNHAVDAEH